jgi:hypothetical protein
MSHDPSSFMRSHARDAVAPDRQPFGAVDMELLRKCPCPVFLVRHGSIDPHPQIVAAVNASTEEASERALNVKIVEMTLLIAELEGGVPLLLQAWVPFAERMVRSHSSDDAFAAYVEDVRQRTVGDLRHLAQSCGGASQACRPCIAEGSRRRSSRSSSWPKASTSWSWVP